MTTSARSIDFSTLFRSPSLDDEWSILEAQLAKVFSVPDGTTGGVNPGDRRAIYYLTRQFVPSSVLEIGTHVGCSTLHFAAALLGNSGRLTTVDIEDVNAPDASWCQAGLNHSPRQLLEVLGFAANFVVSDSLAFLRGTSEVFDIVFLDGDHSTKKVYSEILEAVRVLRPNGILLLHDYFPGGVCCWKGTDPALGPYEAVQQLQREGLVLQAVPFGELPWPTKLGTNITSLAALILDPLTAEVLRR